MNTREPRADGKVSALYDDLRNKHGGSSSRANGYLWHGYFLREQKILMQLVNSDARVVMDVGCGSGLMCQPLVNKRKLVLGIDFNQRACSDAKANGLVVLRGDAFSLPMATASVDEIINCQFFNQQSFPAVEKFIEESARALVRGGRLIMIWRNGVAYVHQCAEFVAKIFSRTHRRPLFPYVNHSIEAIEAVGIRNGLMAEYRAVSFPPLGWISESRDGFAAKCLGASNICVLRKNDD